MSSSYHNCTIIRVTLMCFELRQSSQFSWLSVCIGPVTRPAEGHRFDARIHHDILPAQLFTSYFSVQAKSLSLRNGKIKENLKNKYIYRPLYEMKMFSVLLQLYSQISYVYKITNFYIVHSSITSKLLRLLKVIFFFKTKQIKYNCILKQYKNCTVEKWQQCVEMIIAKPGSVTNVLTLTEETQKNIH